MARISNLPDGSNTLAAGDLFPFVDASDGLNKRVTAQALVQQVPLIATGSTTARSLAVRFAEVKNAMDYGAIGNGVADDTSAIQDALDAGPVFLPPGTYRLDAELVCNAANAEISGVGRDTVLLKHHTGNAIRVTNGGTGCHIRNLRIQGDTGSSATYAQGRGIYFDHATTSNPRLNDLVVDHIDSPIEFAKDAGSFCQGNNLWLDPYTQTAGTEGYALYFNSTGAESGATQRSFSNVYGNGIIQCNGTQDLCLNNAVVRRIQTDADSFNVNMRGGMCGAVGETSTFDGAFHSIGPMRIAGPVTLGADFTGTFIGVEMPGYALTDNSTGANNLVLIRPNNTHAMQFGRALFLQEYHSGYGGLLEATTVSGDRGDASFTLTKSALGDETVQMMETALSQNRTITLDTASADLYEGARFRVVRTGLGAFTLDVGGLKTIPSATAAWVEVMWNGAAWKLVGYGLL